GHSPSHSRDECREPALGRSADTRRTAQARHRRRTDHGRKIHGEEKDAAIAGLEDLPSQSCRRQRVDGSVTRPHHLVSGVVWRAGGEVLWLGVTAHPSAEWIVGQLTEAYGWQQAPRYIIRDRDCVYGDVFVFCQAEVGIRDRPIAPRSPWQNGCAERLIGSIRRDCLDHFVVFGEQHLRHLLKSYQAYYNEARTHLSLQKDAPIPRAVQAVGQTLAVPVLGGLHHRYIRV